MIEIYIHIEPLGQEYHDIETIVYFPIVPRIGERIILGSSQKNDLLSQLRNKECEYYVQKTTGKVVGWGEIMDEINIVSDVAYYAKNSTIHVELTFKEN